MPVSINRPQPITHIRAWGAETTVIHTMIHACKILERYPDTESPGRGFQMHVKEETHYLERGQLLLEILQDGAVTSHMLHANDVWTVPPCVFHRETAITPCRIIEVSDPTVDDRFRSGDDYGGLRSMTDTEAIEKLKGLAVALRGRAAECDGLADIIQRKGLASYRDAALGVAK